MDDAERDRLRRLNRMVALLHAAQAVLLLVIASDASLPVTSTWMTGPPGSGEFAGPEELFDVTVAPLVALFLALAAVDHALMTVPGIEGWYRRNLARGGNPARWWEYSVSASLMVVLIAMLTGISEITALIAIFGVNSAMILFGLAMERANPPGQPVDWRPFVYGCIVGAVPWIAIAFQMLRSESATGGDVPGFVFAIFVTLFVLFNSFALNMALHYRARKRGSGRWRDPLFTERVYLWLSLVAKSALAWQVYAGALAGG